MNTALLPAAAISWSFTWYGANTRARSSASDFLAHRRPHVRVDRIGARDGRARIVRDFDRRAVTGDLAERLDGRGGQLVTGGRRDAHVDAQHRAGVRQRHGDVVAVADERQRRAFERAQAFPQRQHVGQRLARMFLVGERVDDVHRGRGFGKPIQPLLRERADDGAVEPALEVARDVLDGFPPAERDVGRRFDHFAAQFPDGDRERRARAQRRLLEHAAPRAGRPAAESSARRRRDRA